MKIFRNKNNYWLERFALVATIFAFIVFVSFVAYFIFGLGKIKEALNSTEVLAAEYHIDVIKDKKISEKIYENKQRIIYATVTAYSSKEGCDDRDCITASGLKASVGFIACPREYPFGTKVHIGELTYICEDRTSKKYNGRFDVFTGYGDKGYKDAITFGIKKKVKIIVEELSTD